jgi:hypothetical protein
MEYLSTFLGHNPGYFWFWSVVGVIAFALLGLIAWGVWRLVWLFDGLLQ